MDGIDLFRWLVGVVAFVAGCHFGRKRIQPTNFVDGVGYFEDIDFQKDGPVISVRAGAPLTVPVVFSLRFNSDTARAWRDRADASCEDPRLLDLLSGDASTSAAVTALLAEGVTMIAADGDNLWIHRGTTDLVSPAALRPLFQLRDALAPITRFIKTSSRSFRMKRILLEGMTWFFISFVVTNVVALYSDVPAHVRWENVISAGIVVALIMAAVLAAAFLAMFGRSLDLGGAVVRTIVALLIGIPSMAIPLTSDVNRYLDRSPDILITKDITSRRLRARTGRGEAFAGLLKGPHCYLGLSQAPGDRVALPREIEVTPDVCRRATPGRQIEFRIGSGWLGLPWYRSITPR